MIVFALMLVIAPVEEQRARCDFDRSVMLALDQKAFDQDIADGWRGLANKKCDEQAADLIRDWRNVHQSQDTILFWHEGQMRANAGQYERAIPLFERARHPAAEDAKWGWNLYVDGSIAFLRGDPVKLERARAELALLPKPAELKDVRDATGKPAAIRWPMNLHVLDALLRCWGQSYRIAYSCPAVVS